MDNQPVNSEIEKFVQLSKNEKNVKQKNVMMLCCFIWKDVPAVKFLRFSTFRAGQCLDTYLFTLKAVRKPSSSADNRAELNF